MPLIYLIVEREDRIPTLTATSMEMAKNLLDEYMGMPPYYEDKDVEYLGYEPYVSKYGGDIFEGIYKYRDGNEIQEFGLYCMEINALN
jgi:hypothetical protein